MASLLEKELDLGRWTITEEGVRQYLKAVGDASPIYLESGLAPPMALAAYALGALLDKLTLPPGAIHSIQKIETLQPARLGEEITGIARLGKPKRRGSMEFITADYTLADSMGQRVLAGRSTVLVTSGAV